MHTSEDAQMGFEFCRGIEKRKEREDLSDRPKLRHLCHLLTLKFWTNNFF